MTKKTTLFVFFAFVLIMMIPLASGASFTLATEKTLLFYALGGFSITNLYSSFDSENPELGNSYEVFPGLNIGTGIEMIVAEDINAFTQIKYVVGKYQYLAISIGVHYYISGRRYRTW